MTIGEALKIQRLNLHLTQEEMSAGIISRAEYGKIEKDLHDISAQKLLKLLEYHNINSTIFSPTFPLLPLNHKIILIS